MWQPSELSIIFELTICVVNFISFLPYNDLRFWYIGKFLVMVWMAILTSSSFSVALPRPTGDIYEQPAIVINLPGTHFTFTVYFWIRNRNLWSLRGDLANDYFCILASRGLRIYNHLSPKCVLVKFLSPIDYGKWFSFNVGIVFFSRCWNYLLVCVVLIILGIYLATKLVIERRCWPGFTRFWIELISWSFQKHQ